MAGVKAGQKVVPATFEFEGASPTGLANRLIVVPKGRILKHLQETGNQSVLEEAWLIPEVCMAPTAIWRGLQRNGQEEAFCYCGKPDGSFAKSHGMEVAIPEGCVFLVFLTTNLEVTKWRFCKEDEQSPGFPVSHETRFGERTWPLQD